MLPLAGRDDLVAVHLVVPARELWNQLATLRALGASGIVALPPDALLPSSTGQLERMESSSSMVMRPTRRTWSSRPISSVISARRTRQRRTPATSGPAVMS